MRSLILALAYFPLAWSQLSSLPTCAQNCFNNAINDVSCGTTDYNCLCSSSTFHEEYICCVRSECDSIDSLTVGEEAVVLCAEYGVIITALPASACSTAQATTTTTAGTQNTVATTATGFSEPTSTSTSSWTSSSSSDSSDFNLGGSKKRKSKLSSGGKAGIGVGVASAVIIILAAVGWWIKRRRTASQPGISVQNQTSYEAPGPVGTSPLDHSSYQTAPIPEKEDIPVPVSPIPPSELSNSHNLGSDGHTPSELSYNPASPYSQQPHNTQPEIPGHPQYTRHELQ